MSGQTWRQILIDWAFVEVIPRPRQGEVQLWRIDLREGIDLAAAHAGLLTANEQAHAARLRDRQTREQFIAGRGALRVLVGNALGLDPLHVPILKGIHGKPELALSVAPPLFFNVAHSGAIVMIAITWLAAVGVDLEHLDREIDELAIARHSFNSKEVDNLARVADPTQLRRAFFRCWTQKEAIVKADGRGLSLPLSSFAVPIDLAGGSQVCVPDMDDQGCKSFSLREVAMGEEMAGAFALASTPDSEPALVAAFQFPPDILW